MKKFAILFSVFALSLACVFASCGKKESYTVTLKANYSEGQDQTLTMEEGSVLNDVEFPVRKGYELSFWSFDAEGNQRLAFPLEIDKNYTLYAQWKVNENANTEYNFSFSLGGGSGKTPDNIVGKPNESIALPDENGFSRDYHIFAGWKDTKGNIYEGGANYTVTGDETFTAVWSRAVEVSFDLDGGSGEAPAALKVAANGNITLPACDTAKDGYSFDGWLYNGVRYAVGAEVALSDDEEVTLFAAWKGRYTISFDPDFDGASVPENIVSNTGSDEYLPEITEKRDDFAFDGWTDGVNVYTDYYTVGYGDVVLKAVWKDTTYTVTFKDWDGGVITEQKVSLGENPVEPDVFVNKLSEFAGWDKDLSSITGETVVTAKYNVEFSPVSYFKFAKSGFYYYITDTGALYDADRPTSIVFPASYNGLPVAGIVDNSDFRNAPYYRDFSLREVYFPSNWTMIGQYAFFGATGLSQISFGENSVIKSLGYGTFYECDALVDIVLPASLENIGESTFTQSAKLRSVRFEEGSKLKTIGNRAFGNCFELVSIDLPAGLDFIDQSAFYYCVKLESIVLPDSVTEIAAFAFSGCYALSSVNIGENSKLDTLGTHVFSSCKALKEIYLPAGITTVPYKAFQSCGALEKVTLAGNITEIGEFAFESCNSLIMLNSDVEGVANIPESVVTIDNYAFCMTGSLVSVNFGENSKLQKLGMYMFAGDNPTYKYEEPMPMSLEKLVLPVSLKEIGENLLYKNFSVQSIEVAAGNTVYESDGMGLYVSATKNLLAYAAGNPATEYTVLGGTKILPYTFYNAQTTKVVLPDTVREIGDFAFAESALTNIDLGENVTLLGEQAFSGSKLTSVVLPANLTAVSVGAFAFCEDLESVTFAADSKIKSVEEGAFASCTALKSIDFGENGSLEYIGQEALAYTGLESVVIPATVTEIGRSSFANNEFLSSVTIEENSSLKTIGVDAFAYNTKLTSFRMPASVQSWGEYSFQFTSALKDFTFEEGFSLAKLPNGVFHTSGLSQIELPDSINEIGEYAFAFTNFVSFETSVDAVGKYAFYHASSLESITFTGGVTQFGIHTFSECGKLTTVILPETLSYIGNFSFNKCSSLQEIVLPASVDQLGMSAFRDCTALEKVTLKKNGVTATDGTAFGGCNALAEIHVPANVVQLYKSDAGWLNFASIIVGDPV